MSERDRYRTSEKVRQRWWDVEYKYTNEYIRETERRE